MMIRDFVIFIRCIKILKHLINQLSDEVVSYKKEKKKEKVRRGQMITSKSTVHERCIL